MSYLGEFDVKIDAKCRLKLPSALLRQVGDDASRFVLNRGFENCLVLYTKRQWDKETKRLSVLNPYDKKHRQFLRYYFRGATELSLDASDRLLLPKSLMQYAEISKEVVVFAHMDKIELWDKERYEEFLAVDSDEFSDLAGQVMGFEIEED